MKKRLLSMALAVVMAVCLVGCSNVENERKKDTSMFVCVETTATWQIVYHKETRVMYAVSDGSYNYGTFTVLLDADGKPMLWESKN